MSKQGLKLGIHLPATPGSSVEGEQSIELDQAVKVAKDDLRWEHCQIAWVLVEVRPKLDRLGKEKPGSEDDEAR